MSDFVHRLNSLFEKSIEETDENQEMKSVWFFQEQLNLLVTPKNTKKYCISLLTMSYVIFATSEKGYKRHFDEQILILPSVKTFRNITLNFIMLTDIAASY